MKEFKLLSEYKRQIINFLYLSCIQTVNLISPLVILPFLIIKFGIEGYGSIAFAQAISFYVSTLINFGFNVSGTKKISEFRNEKKIKDKTISSIYIIKLIIYLFLVAVVYGFFLFSGKWLSNDSFCYLVLLYTISTLYDVFFPVWYFLGIEKMKIITITNTISKLLFCISIFIFIGNQTNILLVPILFIICNLLAIIFPLFILFKAESYKPTLPNKMFLISTIKEAYIFFIADFMAILKDRTNILIIGSCLSMSSVAYFDVIQKIIGFIRSIFINFNNAFFPLIVRTRRQKDVKIGIWGSLGFSILTYLIMVTFSDILISFLSKGRIENDTIVFSIAALFIITASISSTIGLFILIPNGYQNKFLYNLFLATLVYLLLIMILFLTNNINLISLLIAYNMSVFIELCHRCYLCYKFKLTQYLLK